LVITGCEVLLQAVFGKQQAALTSLPVVIRIYHADYDSLLSGNESLQTEVISMLTNNEPKSACYKKITGCTDQITTGNKDITRRNDLITTRSMEITGGNDQITARNKIITGNIDPISKGNVEACQRCLTHMIVTYKRWFHRLPSGLFNNHPEQSRRIQFRNVGKGLLT